MYKKAKPARIESPKKVLILESDPMTRNVLSKIITSYLGCDVNIAANHREAVSFLKSMAFDLLIVGLSSDVSPILNFIEDIRSEGNGIPIITVIGDCADSDLDTLRNAGLDRIVYKPLKLSPFLEVVTGAFLEKERVINFA